MTALKMNQMEWTLKLVQHEAQVRTLARESLGPATTTAQPDGGGGGPQTHLLRLRGLSQAQPPGPRQVKDRARRRRWRAALRTARCCYRGP